MFKKKKLPKVTAPVSVILRNIEESIRIEALISVFVIKSNGVEYKLGMTINCDKNEGIFNTIYFLDDQEFDTFESFKENATFQMGKFVDFKDDVEIISIDEMHPTNVIMFQPYAVKED